MKIRPLFSLFFFISCAIGALVLGALFFLAHTPWVDLSVLDRYNTSTYSVLLDDEGNEWAQFRLDHRQPIPLSAMPQHLVNAFLAAEDHHFFSHSGISYRGILRSLVVNLIRGKKVQGASTITQQLVRLVYFDQHKTFTRKVKEQIVSLAIEHQYTKEFILEMYLNNIYFGCGIYGVEAASQRFWGKSAQQLSTAESACLAAIIKNPAFYCPLLHPRNTLARKEVILKQMSEQHFISPEEHDRALRAPLTLRHDESENFAPHARETLRIFLEKLLGKRELYTEGYRIQTTLNRAQQQAAEKSFKKHMRMLKATYGQDTDGALVTLETSTGAIKALIGGADFATSQFNRALHAHRQFGSIFKPLVYAAALDAGLQFSDICVDEPLRLVEHAQVWEPHNHTNTFDGPMTLARALSVSNNIIAIKTLMKIGVDRIIHLAKAAHLERNLVPYPSLALGCVEGSVAEAAAMFNLFANKGIYVEPHLLVWVKDSWGKKIWKYTEVQESVLSWTTSSKVCHVLAQNFRRFIKKRPTSWENAPEIISKTGTTNQSRNCWFAGASPSYTTVVYVGHDNNAPLGERVFPTTTAFPLWLEAHSAYPHQQHSFSYDPSLHKKIIDAWAGEEIFDPNTPRALSILVPSEQQT